MLDVAITEMLDFESLISNVVNYSIDRVHRHLRNIDCLTEHTACLVCFISTVNGRSKKRKKRSILRAVLVAGTQQNLHSLYYLDVYDRVS